ncbi:DUF992 domain-containing protein [Mesorhizobium sp. SB112]|uniref:DUF992 domain-containing protein n=1 Tax=Mesorhizobium sp. SB112 TaxID=3151853 RepID=UPI00326307E8
MKKILATAFLVPLALAGTSFANAADFTANEPVYQQSGAQGGVRIGYLSCEVGGGVGYVIGSAKTVDCVFTPTVGNDRSDNYTGTIRKMGVDLGFTTRGKLVWAVFAPTAGYHDGSLSGVYQGATAEATVGAGVGANVLVGGTAGSIQLQTVSVTGQLGLNVAATGTSVTLNSVN